MDYDRGVVAVPGYIADNARRGLDLIEFAGSGLRPQTIREARAMAAGNVSEDKVVRMAAWFARHLVDLNSARAGEYLRGESQRPTPGQVAWLLWGGDLGENRRRAMEWAQRTRDRLVEKADASEIRVGGAYQYAVPKPPGATEYGTGIAVEVFRSGTIERAGDTREATADDPAVLLQVYAVDEDRRLTETDRRVLRSASELRSAGDISDRIDKEVSARVRESLQRKVEEHNSEHGSSASKRVNLRMLTAVFERGVGAYRGNPSSVRPNVGSADQWAHARVNVFLQAVRSGRFPRAKFDTDLLPSGHPLSTRKAMSEETNKEHVSYPDGEPIPHALPAAYAPAQGAQRCDNCQYYKIGACLKWGAAVRAGYWCAAWKPLLAEVEVDVEQMQHDEEEPVTYGYMQDEDKGYGLEYLRKEIREQDGEFCVYSEGGGRSFGCYSTEAEAEQRLAQIEQFSRSLDHMTAEQLIAAHDLIHKSETVSPELAAAHDVVEDRLEALGFAPPYTLGDTTEKLAALHSVVPFAKAEERYTLGPVYVPGRLDGHGEFIDAATLQKAIWDWVRGGDRTIYLQHSERPAGEMVEILTWPMPIQTSLTLPGEEIRKVEFPPETPFMGVVWESWSWDLVKAGQLRGYSIGGKARRVEADLSISTPAE